MKVLVAGATGETGRRIVQTLTQQHIPTRALVRDPAKAQAVLPANTELVVGDVLKPATLTTALEGCDRIICATGARPGWDPLAPFNVDYVGTKNLVNAAKAADIQHFVLISSLCVSEFFHPLNLFFLVLFWKKQAEDYLMVSGIPYTIIRPGGLKNDDTPGGLVVAPPDTLFTGSIPRSQVAELAVAALHQPQARNRILEVISKTDIPSQPYSELFA
ncbi:MAG: SDR family oxidoreductase [Thermostichales cyanobacterium BF4_bins_65]